MSGFKAYKVYKYPPKSREHLKILGTRNVDIKQLLYRGPTILE